MCPLIFPIFLTLTVSPYHSLSPFTFRLTHLLVIFICHLNLNSMFIRYDDYWMTFPPFGTINIPRKFISDFLFLTPQELTTMFTVEPSNSAENLLWAYINHISKSHLWFLIYIRELCSDCCYSLVTWCIKKSRFLTFLIWNKLLVFVSFLYS